MYLSLSGQLYSGQGLFHQLAELECMSMVYDQNHHASTLSWNELDEIFFPIAILAGCSGVSSPAEAPLFPVKVHRRNYPLTRNDPCA
jgi:hypothetical protein